MELLLDLAAPADTTHEAQSHYNRAIENIGRNNYRKALDHLTRAVHAVPTNPMYLSSFGFCIAYVHRDFDRAIRLCRQALKRKPLDPVLRVNLGKVYRMCGDSHLAHSEFLLAHRLDNCHPAPATELQRMGIRRPPMLPFLSRSNWCNRYLGKMRATVERGMRRAV